MGFPGKSTTGLPASVIATICPTQQAAEPTPDPGFGSKIPRESICISILLNLTALDDHIAAPFDIYFAAFDGNVAIFLHDNLRIPRLDRNFIIGDELYLLRLEHVLLCHSLLV